MARDPRATVEASLEIARRATTRPAEREAAIAAAERLISRHGLDVDTFDIPGRAKAVAAARRDDLFGSRSAYEEVFRSFEEAIRRGSTKSYLDELRAFEEEQVRRERQRRSAVAGLKADLAISFLWAKEVRVYPTTAAANGSRRFVVPEESGLEYDDDGIVEIARRKGWGPEETVAGAHPFAVQAAQFLRDRGVAVAINPNGREWTVVGDGISYFDKCSHSALMALARQRGWAARGTGHVRDIKTRVGKAEMHCRLRGVARDTLAAMGDAEVLATAARLGWQE